MKHGAPPRHLTAKAVTVAFVLSLTVFCGALFLPGLLEKWEMPDPAETDAAIGRSRTAVLFFRDTVDTLTGAVVVTYDTRTLAMTATGYAPETPAGDTTLAEAYRTGAVYAQTLLCGDADGALSFSVSNVAAFLVYLRDRLPLTLPEAVGDLPAGWSTLTPLQVADLLRYDGWSDGAEGRAAIHAEVVAALLNRYLTADRDLEAAFKKLTELCDDRLTIAGFAAVREDLEALAVANKGDLCTVR